MDFNQRLVVLLKECIEELNKINIPISKNIHRIMPNNRAKSRFGCCIKKKQSFGEDFFNIEISTVLENSSDKEIKEIIIHELLHTCKGCLNHGYKWKNMSESVNYLLGYSVKTTSSYSKLNLDTPESKETYKYKITCKNCGNIVLRKRKTKVLDHISNYRCIKCGGPLEVSEYEEYV